MARVAGIDMAECRLLEENGRAHFMTLRFDRELGRKVHIQTLCAMAHLDFNQVGAHAYGQAYMTLKDLKLAPEAQTSSSAAWSSTPWAGTATTIPRTSPSRFAKVAPGCLVQPTT